MKKVFLFAALAVVAIALSGCNKTESPRDPYTWIFTVVNDTDSEIVVSYDSYSYGYYSYGSEISTFEIAPGESKVVFGHIGYGDYNDPPTDPDGYATDDVLPFGVKLDQMNDEIWEELKTKIMVGDRELSHEVWLRDYWSFEEKENYIYNYALTVNDELVEELAITDPDLPQQ